jgi:nickel-dependent lactate racemase
LQHAAEEAGWLVGSPYTIQVVPGADDTALHVLAGDPRAVFYRGGQLCTEAWRSAIPRRAELVIATVTGHGQQTWESVARALAVAANAVEEDGGALAVCCQLSDEPGAALQRLAGADDPSAALRRIGKRKPADTLVAAEIAQMLERGKFYLVSQLEDELVESLGILPIAASQLSRLAERYESCLVLENAQYAVAASSDEPSAPSGAIQSRSAS